jgi:hypothetical protein
MFTYLSLGHLGVDPSTDSIVVEKPLDMNVVMRLLRELGQVEGENATLGGYRVYFEEGYVRCPWLMDTTVRQTEVFARRLHEETGCAVVDTAHRAWFDPKDFK